MNTTKSSIRLAVGTLLAVVGISCFAQSQTPDHPSAEAAPSATGAYLIGTLDVLNVFVMGFPEYSARVQVGPDGNITTPLVEDMLALGKTSTQLARDIESVLAEYVRTPRVTVSIESFVGAISTQIRVLGEVVAPGSLPFRSGMTVLDVILEVGGITEFAAARRATLSRIVDGKQQEMKIRLDRLLERGDLSWNYPVQPGDVIVVPQTVL